MYTVRMRDGFQTSRGLIGNKAAELARITRTLLFIARPRNASAFHIGKFDVVVNIP